MCTIEVFDIVYPNGTRQRGERLVEYCSQGTPHHPCRNVRYVNTFEERQATDAEVRAGGAGPWGETMNPRGEDRSASRPGSKEKDSGVLGGITKTFKDWKRSSWGKKGRKDGTKMAFVRPVSREHESRPPQFDYPLPQNIPPRAPSPPRWQPAPVEPQIIPIRPSDERDRGRRGRPEPEHGRRRRRSPRPIVIHQSDSEEETPSPPKAVREHHRSRSLSPNSKYKLEKQKMQREKDQRKYAERVAQEQRAAHERAEKLAELQRLEAARSRQDRIDYEERKRIESAQRARRRREREEWERDQAKRRQELADIERIRAATARDAYYREQEERDRLDRAAAARERRWRQEEEADRRARARRANVPVQPHHAPFIHQPENMVDRGERYIRDAIRQANLRQFERRSPPTAGRRDEGHGLRRHHTTGGTHLRGNGGDPPWNSR